MNSFLHILISRFFALALFGIVLMLTPRSWVDAKPIESVPVQALEPRDDAFCFWCSQPENSKCQKSKTPIIRNSPKIIRKITQRTWLNPDARLRPVDLRPCVLDSLADSDLGKKKASDLVL